MAVFCWTFDIKRLHPEIRWCQSFVGTLQESLIRPFTLRTPRFSRASLHNPSHSNQNDQHVHILCQPVWIAQQSIACWPTASSGSGSCQNARPLRKYTDELVVSGAKYSISPQSRLYALDQYGVRGACLSCIPYPPYLPTYLPQCHKRWDADSDSLMAFIWLFDSTERSRETEKSK